MKELTLLFPVLAGAIMLFRKKESKDWVWPRSFGLTKWLYQFWILPGHELRPRGFPTWSHLQGSSHRTHCGSKLRSWMNTFIEKNQRNTSRQRSASCEPLRTLFGFLTFTSTRTSTINRSNQTSITSSGSSTQRNFFTETRFTQITHPQA